MDDPLTLTLPVMPAPLRPLGSPVEARVTGPAALTLAAGPCTDLFADPGSPGRFTDAPALLTTPHAGDFVLSARVRAGLSATYDAGALLLCTPAPAPGPSSPSNCPPGQAHRRHGRHPRRLRRRHRVPRRERRHLAARGPRRRGVRLHTAMDGRFRHLVRWFALPDGTPPEAGFLAQSPTGAGLPVRFEEIVYARRTFADPRDGS
ncbi:hypothetical protein ACL02R_19280 [Streptomyces sp. MS19]|uniref:hypothetical protein n=1 Tax=Streptomyces sp. MS19 TaxID=3385972 RepID=UPI00399F2512